jgi:hypothetical protein
MTIAQTQFVASGRYHGQLANPKVESAISVAPVSVLCRHYRIV